MADGRFHIDATFLTEVDPVLIGTGSGATCFGASETGSFLLSTSFLPILIDFVDDGDGIEAPDLATRGDCLRDTKSAGLGDKGEGCDLEALWVIDGDFGEGVSNLSTLSEDKDGDLTGVLGFVLESDEFEV